MPIYQSARFEVRPEALENCEQAIRLFVEYVRANEPDTLSYTSFQEKEHPTRFLHVFVFRDADARDVHANSIAVNHFTGVLYPNVVSPVEFTEYQVFAETGSR